MKHIYFFIFSCLFGWLYSGNIQAQKINPRKVAPITKTQYKQGNISKAITNKTTQTLKATVDESVELVSTVFRIAGTPGYVTNDAKSYAEDVDKTFAPMAKHPVFDLIHQMGSQHGLSYDGVAIYAAMIEINKGRIRFKANADINELPKRDNRWTLANARKFSELLTDFYQKSHYHKFFLAHQKYYKDSVLVNFNPDVVSKVDWPWFAKFFGVQNIQYPHIVAAPLDLGNYGVGYTDRFSGKRIATPIIGPYKRKSNGSLVFGPTYGVLVHEYGHVFSNPAVEHYRKQLEPIANKFVAPVIEKLRKMSYATGYTCIIETMNRACNLQYDIEHAANASDSADVRISMAKQKCNGFLLIEDAYKALNDYRAERNRYPSYDAFMPVIIDRFSHLKVDSVLNECNARCGLMTLEGITDGDTSVAPGEQTVILHFTTQHFYGFGLSTGRKGKNSVFPSIKKMHNDKNGDIILTLDLKPATSYSFSIPGAFFISKDGYPMRNTIFLDFTTANATK